MVYASIYFLVYISVHSFKNQLHEIEGKLENAKLNNKPKDVEKYKKELQEIKRQVQILEVW